mmetsp:Transcript_32649/g.71636  ORF Transcript_32649/g.71636 Transcript_32649/m.71636 type:complete len:572 (-) Transcript_32649:66-1781(-)
MVGERIGRFSAKISSSIADTIELIDDKIDTPIILNIKGIKRAGSACHDAARETSVLCNSTVSKASEMVEFGLDIKSTLDGLGGQDGIDASTFQIIKDLIDGDKMRAAMSLAGEMDDLALACVDQSVKMIDAMEKGIDELPDILEARVDKRMDKAKEEGGREGDPELPDIDPDVQELERTIEAVRDVNLFTAMKSGRNAFDGLTSKGEICKEMFETIRTFSNDVTAVSEAIKNFQLGNMVGKIRDLVKNIWRCLRLSALIRSFSLQVGKLIKWIIQLFKTASEKLSAVWGALAHAKDCLSDCVRHIAQAMHLCDNAKDKSVTLIDTCEEIQTHLGNITKVNKSSIVSIKDLADGDEIRTAIELATNMDDIILAAIRKVVQMIKKVTEGFNNLPNVIKEGLPEDAGTSGDDPEPADVEDDVRGLNRCRGSIEKSNALTTVQASAEGFSDVKLKIGKCRDMITESRGFAESCNGTIESFMGVWTLEDAMSHLIEMMRLVKLGEMMKQFAQEIKRLIKANIAVMKAVMKKIQEIDFIPDDMDDVVDSIKDSIKGVEIDDIKDVGKKLGRFFKKKG